MAENEFVVSVEPSNGNIESKVGETVTGVIDDMMFSDPVDASGWENADYEEAIYLKFVIVEDSTNWTFRPSYNLGDAENPRVTKNTELGAIAQRFGADLSGEGTIDLGEVFMDAEVEFVVAPDGEYFKLKDKDFWPPGEEPMKVDTGGESESDSDGDSPGVLDIVSDMEGSSEREVKLEIADVDGSLLSEYNELKENGTITVEDGTVSL